MPSFALITEGVTDQVVLEKILIGHYDSDDIDIYPLQPCRDATDRHYQANHGGWNLVLEYCRDRKNIKEDLILNDYLIIQIDTDVAEEKGFDVSLTDGGKEREINDIIQDVKKRISTELGDDIINQYQEKIIYAICVHSLECWLLPLHATKSNTHNCEKRLAHVIRLAKGKFEKNSRCYDVLASGYAKPSVLRKHRSRAESLDLFLSSLPPLES